MSVIVKPQTNTVTTIVECFLIKGGGNNLPNFKLNRSPLELGICFFFSLCFDLIIFFESAVADDLCGFFSF